MPRLFCPRAAPISGEPGVLYNERVEYFADSLPVYARCKLGKDVCKESRAAGVCLRLRENGFSARYVALRAPWLKKVFAVEWG